MVNTCTNLPYFWNELLSNFICLVGTFFSNKLSLIFSVSDSVQREVQDFWESKKKHRCHFFFLHICSNKERHLKKKKSTRNTKIKRSITYFFYTFFYTFFLLFGGEEWLEQRKAFGKMKRNKNKKG